MPIFNEEQTLRNILSKVIAQKLVDKIIVIDDGSTDNTPKILGTIQSSKVQILTHQKNKGKGAAIRTALKELNKGYFIVQDGDLEYDPSQYKALLDFASSFGAVYGSRLLVDKSKHAYIRTYLGNVLVTGFFNILYGRQLTDTYTCYKLLPVKLAKDLNLESNGFEIEAEITAKLAKKKVEILEVPITFSPRKYEEGKKIKATDALKALWTYLKIRFS